MCGITGIINISETSDIDKNLILKMMGVIKHRGPDEEGVFCDSVAGLGFRRLSIIDLELSQQPMFNEDNSVCVIFNGEIYNFVELREELIKQGHKFRSKGDTEVLVHLYEQHGDSFLEKLNGMYALVIYDIQNRKTVIARDCLGIKPLYYTITNNKLIFGSEIKSILEYPGVERRLNLKSLEEYVTFRYVAGKNTLFKNIFELEPGHMIIIDKGDYRVKKYWDLPVDISNNDNPDSQKELESLFEDSVRKRLLSDVPVGTMCSGGIDSSLITAYSAAQRPDRIHTFAVGSEVEKFNELYYSKIATDYLGTEHHTMILTNSQFTESLEKCIWHNDEPLAHPNSVGIFEISKIAKNFITVMLTGEGADELFAGYGRYSGFKRRVRLKKVLQIAPISSFVKFSSRLNFSKINSAHQLLIKPIEDLATIQSSLSGKIKPYFLSGIFLNGELKNNFRSNLFLNYSKEGYDPVSALLAVDVKTYLVSILNRLDKMTMAASIESRVPFLDRRIVEYSFSRMNIRDKLDGNKTKKIIVKIAQKHIPQENITRSKMGFPIPYNKWLKEKTGLGDYINILFDSNVSINSLIDSEKMSAAFSDHKNSKADNSDILFFLFNLELWLRKFNVSI